MIVRTKFFHKLSTLVSLSATFASPNRPVKGGSFKVAPTTSQPRPRAPLQRSSSTCTRPRSICLVRLAHFYDRSPLPLRILIFRDEAGKRYLDGFAGVATVSVGHSHPKIVAAAKEQLDNYIHGTPLYLSHQLSLYARELAKRFVLIKQFLISQIRGHRSLRLPFCQQWLRSQ